MSRIARAGGAAATALATSLAWWACGPGSLSDLTRGSDATTSADAGPCSELGIPARPNAPNDTTRSKSVRFAVAHLKLDVRSRDGSLPSPRSLNLDRTCTCPGAGSCVRSARAAQDPCDDDQGRDNQAAVLVTQTPSLTAVSDQVDKQLRGGRFSILIELSDWNGTPDDSSVAAQVHFSSGIAPGPDGGPAPDAGFDGNDTWSIDVASLIRAKPGDDCERTFCQPAIEKATGWVASGRLVIPVIDVPIVIDGPAGPFRIPLHAGVVLADIVPPSNGGPHRLARGELIGRWPVKDFLESLSSMKYQALTFCVGEPSYEEFKKQICAAVDITTAPAADGTGAACDAISTAIAFDAVEARYGLVAEGDHTPTSCPPATHSCE